MIKISKTEIPLDLFEEYCKSIRLMGSLRPYFHQELIIKSYRETDLKRQDLHNRILTYVNNDKKFDLELSKEIELIVFDANKGE